MKRILSLMLALLMAAALFAGCTPSATGETNTPPVSTSAGGDTGGSTAAPADTGGDEPTPSVDPKAIVLPLTDTLKTYTIFATFDTSATTIQTYAECMYFQEMQRRTNVAWEWIHPPGTSAQEQFQIMIAGQMYDDVVRGFSSYYTRGIDDAIAQDIIYPLNDYTEYLPNLMGYVEADSDKKMQMLSDSGYYWGIPCMLNVEQGSWGGSVVRADLLDKYGLSMPITFDDWEVMLTTWLENEPTMSNGPLALTQSGFSFVMAFIAGYNYAADRYLYDESQFTNWISVGSETFPKDLAYNWNLVKNNASVIGDFVWTSWDYLGEAGIGRDSYRNGPRAFGGDYPWLTANDADFDITGRQTPQGYYREIVVGHRTAPYVAVQDPAHYADEPMTTGWSWPGTVSSWNLPGFEGKPVRVDVYGIGDEAELFINGESLGRKPIPQESVGQTVSYRVIFDAVYQPGKAEAVIYKAGAEIGRYAVETVGDAAALAVAADRSEIWGCDADLAYIDIDLVDAQGRRNPGAEARVTVAVEGAGVLQGLGSGAPCTEEPFYETSCTTYFGHALAVVRPTGAGEIKVTVSADGFAPVAVTVKAK